MILKLGLSDVDVHLILFPWNQTLVQRIISSSKQTIIDYKYYKEQSISLSTADV